VAAPLALAHHAHSRFRGGPIDQLTAGLVVALLLAKLAAGVFFGLWWGERGRRLAAERYATTGNPLGPQAQRLADAPDAEGRALIAGRAAAEARFSEATIQKGIVQLQAEAAAAGRPLSPTDARQQALAMLYGTGDAELDLPELGV
jgi:hypothetical protein